MPGPGGVCLVPGGGIPPCTEADPSLGTEFLTHASENITLPQTSFAGGKNEEVKKLLQIKSCDSVYGRHGGMGREIRTSR